MMWTETDHAKLATLFDGVPGPACARCGGDGMQLCEQTPAGECTCGTCRGSGHTVQYPGYKPEVREAPNGDTKACPAVCEALARQGHDRSGCSRCKGTGRVPNVDAGPAGKRYLHVAPKYNPPAWAADYYDRAFAEACRVATALGVPAAYRPHEAYGALRVLEYPSAGHVEVYGRYSDCLHCGASYAPGWEADVCPALAPGAGTVEHTDPDMFTIVLWRSTPEDLIRTFAPGDTRESLARLSAVEPLSPGLHIGEIGELVGLGPATPHRVPARPYVQKSIVYFAIPDHAARLPCTSCLRDSRGTFQPHGGTGTACGFGLTVGEWLADAMARRRYEAQP